jgi:hypothetical protein
VEAENTVSTILSILVVCYLFLYLFICAPTTSYI